MKLVTIIPCPWWARNTCAWILFNQHLDLPHLSGGWLILLNFNKCVPKPERGNYFVYIKKKNITKLFTCYLQFVSGALKWPQNLAGWKLVFNKLGVLWQPRWLCVLHWAFAANFNRPHTLQYEKSCWHVPCWSPSIPSPTYHHQHGMLAPAPKHNIRWSCWSPDMPVHAGFSSRVASICWYL